MEIEKLNKMELEVLKSKIDNKIKEIARQEIANEKAKNRIKNKTKLSQLSKNDSIFGINFTSKRYYKGYAKIILTENDNGFTSYSTFNDKTAHGLGCSSAFNNDYLEKHYFLVEFCSSFYFFTLRPDDWQEDLKDAMDFHTKQKRERLNNEIKGNKNIIKHFIIENANLIDD